MEKAILVGSGGFLGSLLRYALGGALNRTRVGAFFPQETLVINVAGRGRGLGRRCRRTHVVGEVK